jgi:hypothetical protein
MTSSFVRPCVTSAIAVLSAALVAPPSAAADPPPDGGRDPYPLAQGNYTTAGDVGWIFFKTPWRESSFGCGIGPDGTVGCDAVPTPTQIGDAPPIVVPPGANQTIATPHEAAVYRYSATPTFTRNVDVLPEGHQLVNGDASCAVGYQGSVGCKTGEHGFVHYSIWGNTY